MQRRPPPPSEVRCGTFRHRFIAEAVLLVLARAVNPAGPCRIREAAVCGDHPNFFVGKTQLSVQEEKHLDLSALLKVVLMGREVGAAVVSYTADLRTSVDGTDGFRVPADSIQLLSGVAIGTT